MTETHLIRGTNFGYPIYLLPLNVTGAAVAYDTIPFRCKASVVSKVMRWWDWGDGVVWSDGFAVLSLLH